ncbi:bifunctional diguanylate cyclase/phosphodiesterase [Agaricicola taiwanensis]|uniref:Bifunctional diguanylate cyclase/phosphodiesterase n=2 Tax=Agaricicola taiwanensis TaxID=591372 RepID=A0A8J2VP19_9RHOB|nr:bifunctional diguanylate cyclase/phosphodiesterase [Agaricicola taiwanensis]
MRANAAAAAVLGCGMWSMQFIGTAGVNGLFGAEFEPILNIGTFVVIALLAFGAFQVVVRASVPLVWVTVGAALGIGLSAGQQLLMSGSVLPVGFSLTGSSMILAFGGAAVLGAASTYLFRRLSGQRGVLGGAITMTLALTYITSGIALDYQAAFAWASIPVAGPQDMPSAFFVTTGVVIAFSLALLFGNRRRRKASAEMDRMRALANVAFEGIVVCKDALIVHANLSFASLIGRPHDDLTGIKFTSLLTDPSCLTDLEREGTHRIEAEISGAGGSQAAEIFMRDVMLHDSKHRVYAIRDIRERKLSEARIQFLAHHDPVTGLPNRTQFLDRLEQEINRSSRSNGEFAVICLDLDRFKEVNDTFGHAAGDQLLRLAAERLRRVFRTYDVVGRIGGDEFVIMQCAATQPDSAITASRRVIAAFAEPFDLDGLKITVGASAGIAIYPSDAEDAEGLLTRADLALYRAKNSGRGTFRIFEPGMDEQLRERRLLATDLRSAVINDDIVLHYQPIVRLEDGKVTGFEALPRWKHHLRGWINPTVFLPLAEEIGLMPALGRRVMHRACAEAASWPNPLGISVNLAPTQLHGALVSLVSETLAETGLSPARLEIDVAEQTLQQRHASNSGTLTALKMLGVRIAVDHFGTGATSLSGLRSCPIDRIKMDSSFVANMAGDPDNMALVRAISSLGRALDIEVSASGCDTYEQIELLKQEGCLEAQGDIFGAPMPIIAFARMTGHYQAEDEPRQRQVAVG